MCIDIISIKVVSIISHKENKRKDDNKEIKIVVVILKI